MERPTIGRIVHYTLSENNATAINLGRGPAESNPHHAGQVVPAIVVWPHDNDQATFNGQAFLDGNSVLWLTSVPYDESGAPGTWRWPVRTDAVRETHWPERSSV